MATRGTVACTFHGSTFVEIAFGDTTLFVDPAFSEVRRGRRVRGETRPCDFVLWTEGGESIDDALDVLEDSEEATLVASPGACKLARSELRLARDRTLDLEPWERASDEAFRVTAVPIAIASPFDEGVSSIEDLAIGAGRAGMGMGRRGLDMGDRLGAGLGRIPVLGQLTRGRAQSALPDLLGAFTGALGQLGNMAPGGGLRGLGIGPIGRGRPGLGFLVEPTEGPSVLHLGRGVHSGADERDLEDIAELGDVDAVVVDVARSSVDALVRAVRALAPSFVLLYRSEDAYERGRRRSAIPVSSFAEAIAEDSDGDIEVQHLRKGDRYVLGPEASAAPRPAAPEAAGKPAVAKATTRETSAE
jgi:hypothetical protein